MSGYSKRKGTHYERELKHMLEERGFFVTRASGSGSDGVSPDLVVLSTTRKFALECKAWKAQSVRIEKKKWEIMSAWEKMTGMPIFLAWKQPRRPWTFLPLSSLREAGESFVADEALARAGMDFDTVIGKQKQPPQETRA